MALEMVEFMDSRLLERSAAWKRLLPDVPVVRGARVDPLECLCPQRDAAEHDRVGSSCVKIWAFSANCWRYFSAVVM